MLHPADSNIRLQREDQFEREKVPESVISRLSPVVLSVFSKGDFHRVDMRTIAKQAGMSFTTIYRYFSDKETLLFRFLAYWLEELTSDAVEAIQDNEGNTYAQIKSYLAVHFSFYERHPDIGRIIFMTVPLERWMQDPTYQYKTPSRMIYSVISKGQKSGLIRNDIRPKQVMDLLFGLFNRTFLSWETLGRKGSLVDKSDICFSLIISGISGQTQKVPKGRPP